MTEKKWIKPVIFLLVLVLIILVLLWHNSFSLMLRGAGLNREEIRYLLEQDKISIGEEKIFQTKSSQKSTPLVL